MWPPTGSLSLPGKKLCWHRKTRHPPAATAVPSAQKVRAPSLANDTGEMCHGVGDSSSVAPARGQRAGLSWATQVKRSAWAGPSDWGKIPLEGNRGEFPHDLHTAGAGPPAPRGGEGAGGQQPSRSGDRKFEAGIPLLLLPQLRKPLRLSLRPPLHPPPLLLPRPLLLLPGHKHTEHMAAPGAPCSGALPPEEGVTDAPQLLTQLTAGA